MLHASAEHIRRSTGAILARRNLRMILRHPARALNPSFFMLPIWEGASAWETFAEIA